MSNLHMSILESIFGNEAVTEEYVPFCDMLLLAFRAENQEEESNLYEKAGFYLINKTPKKEWGRHLIDFAQAIDRKNKRLGLYG